MNIWESLNNYAKLKNPEYNKQYMDLKTNEYENEANLVYQQNLLKLQNADKQTAQQQRIDSLVSGFSELGINPNSPAAKALLLQLHGGNTSINPTSQFTNAATQAIPGTDEFNQTHRGLIDKSHGTTVNVNNAESIPQPKKGKTLNEELNTTIFVPTRDYIQNPKTGQYIDLLGDTNSITEMKTISQLDKLQVADRTVTALEDEYGRDILPAGLGQEILKSISGENPTGILRLINTHVLPEPVQKYGTAMSDWITTYRQIISGAEVKTSERETDATTFFATPGESEQMRKFKQKVRHISMETVERLHRQRQTGLITKERAQEIHDEMFEKFDKERPQESSQSKQSVTDTFNNNRKAIQDNPNSQVVQGIEFTNTR